MQSSRRDKLRLAAVALAIASAFTGGGALWAANPSALWDIVHNRCEPNQRREASPQPCVLVDLGGAQPSGYAVLKDIVGVAQHLYIPLWRSPGVEDPRLTSPDMPNLWKEAWDARTYVSQALGRNLEEARFGMAINARMRRSQDQLHIHLDCLKPAVTAALPELAALARNRWTEVNSDALGGTYRVSPIDAEDFESFRPFESLARSLQSPSDMQNESLAVISFKPEDRGRVVILLASRFDLLHPQRGHAEDLLDHTCGARS